MDSIGCTYILDMSVHEVYAMIHRGIHNYSSVCMYVCMYKERKSRSICPIIRSPGLFSIVANAHSLFAKFSELHSPDIASARRSSCPIIRFPSFVPIVSNAYSYVSLDLIA